MHLSIDWLDEKTKLVSCDDESCANGLLGEVSCEVRVDDSVFTIALYSVIFGGELIKNDIDEKCVRLSHRKKQETDVENSSMILPPYSQVIEAGLVVS